MAAQICFYFHPDPGGNDPIWLFQRWFNHQLEKVVLKSLKHLPKILMQRSHPIDCIKLKTSPSFLKASYMFPFFVGGFLKYHPLRKGRGREKQMGCSSTNPELSCNRRGPRLRLQRDEERFSDAAMRLFSDFDERKARAASTPSLRLKKKGLKHRDYWVTLRKTNMEAEDHPFEKETHLPNLHFWGSMLVFTGVSQIAGH